MNRIRLALIVLVLSASAATADWRDQVAAMSVKVEAALPPICWIDEAALAQKTITAYLAAGVGVPAADAGHIPGQEPHVHSVIMTGTYGGGHCFIAITTYVSRWQLAADAAGLMGFQEVGYYISSAYLVAPPLELQARLEGALAGSAIDLAKGMSGVRESRLAS